MSMQLALALVALISVVGNRFLSILAGIWLRVPALWLLSTVYSLDLLQIPFFYWVYENRLAFAGRLPNPFRVWLTRDWSIPYLGKWTHSLGGVGVMAVAALPTFGGGMWSAVFLAHSFNLRKTWSYFWMGLGSLLSYLSLYWVIDTLIRTLRYFFVR